MTAPFDLLVDFAPGAGPFDVIGGDNYLALDGETGSNASTPDTAALDITDADVRIELEMDDWRLGRAMFGKWTGTGNQRSYVFWITGGFLAWSWSTDGTLANSFTEICPLQVPWQSGRHAVMVTFDANDGGGNRVTTFFTTERINDGGFAQLGDAVEGAATSVFSSTALLRAGEIANPDYAFPLNGKIYAATLRSTIGGSIVANPDFTAQAAGATSFADSTGKTWTLNGGAELIGFEWVDLSDRLLHADWEIGRDDEFEDFPASKATLVLKNDDRLFDPDYTAGTYFGQLLPRVPFRVRSVWSSLALLGAFGAAYASTPDNAALDITGDIDLRADVTLDDWTPAAATTLISKWLTTGNQRSYLFQVNTAGNLRLIHSPDGTVASQIITTSTVALGLANSAAKFVRVTMDVNDGGGNRVVNFYTSDDGAVWTQLGATVTTAGTTSIFSGTAQLELGSFDAGATERILNGRIRSAEVRSGINGTIVANPDFMIQRPAATSFTDGAGRSWSLTGLAGIGIDTATLYDEFYGFVDSGWEQDHEPPKLANVTVKLTDRLGVLAGYKLPDVFDNGVMGVGPVGLWVLDGPSGSESVADMSGNGNEGTVIGAVTFGEPTVAHGLGASARFDANEIEFGRIEITRSTPLVADPSQVSVVATFKARSVATLNFRDLFSQHNGTNGGTGFFANIDTGGRPQFAWVVNGGGIGYELADSVVDGEGHIYFGQSDGIAIDTVVLSTSTATVAGGISNGVGIGGFSGIHPEDHWDGWICAVAVFDRLLIEQERQAIFDGFTMLDGELSGTHINWALDRLGVPAEHRNITDGTVIMGPADTAGQDVLGWIRNVTSTEQGAFYVDHRDGGKLRFTDRYHRFLEDRSTAAQETFSDDPAAQAASVVRVERGELDQAPNGTDSIINQVTAKWRNGEEIIEDAASIAAYGPRSRQIDTEATTANQASSAAEWLVARYAQPRSRVRGIGIHPAAARRGFHAARHLEIHDRVTHRLHPQQIGSASTVTLFIEGVRHEVDDIDWRTRYHLSPAETFAPWIWGVSEWDTETFWG